MTRLARFAIDSKTSVAWRYGVAVLIVSATLGLRLALYPVLGQREVFVLFPIATCLAARLGGPLPGLAAAALGVLGAWFVLVNPRYSFAISDFADAENLALFAVSAVGCAVLGSQLRESVLSMAQSEEGFRQVKQRLNSIYNTVGDVIFQLAVESEGQFRFVSVNAAFLKVTGLNLGAVVGKTVNEVIPEPSLTMVLEKYRQAVEENTIVRWEETSDYPRGRLTGEITIAPVFDSQGRCTHLVGSVHDITDRKRIEEVLRESEDRFRATFEQAAVGIAHVALSGQFLRINQKFCEITGYSQKEMLERTFQEITHPDDLDTDLEQLHRLVRGEIETYSMEKRYIRREGSHVWVNLTVSLLRNKPGEPEWVVSVVQDITDSKRAQAAAFERQKLESVGTLANGIAHDFNNLLHGVMALTELALANLADGLGPEAELKRIRDVAIHGSEIVHELMIYAGKENAVLDLVDVTRIVEAIIDLLEVSISKHARLEMNLEKDLPPVRASAGQLRLIVLNLVTNASDAIGDRDGVIRVTTGFVTVVQDGSWITSEGLVAGDYLQLEVSDTGCGMPLETQANMFDPFFTTKSVGRGLGLAVVQGIVRSLHGAIRLKSAPGKGATFQILLPYTETAAATAGGPIGAGAR